MSKRGSKSRSRSRSLGAVPEEVPMIATPVVAYGRRRDITYPHKAVAIGVGAVNGIFLVVLLIFSILFLTQLHQYSLPDGTKVLNTESGKVLYGGLITAVVISLLSLLVAAASGRGVGTLLVLVALVADVLVLVYMKKLWDSGAVNDKQKLMKDDLNSKFIFWGLIAYFALAGLLIVVSIVHDKKEKLL